MAELPNQTNSLQEDTWENRVKYYSQVATKMFVDTAAEIRGVSLKEIPAKGLDKGIQIPICATGAAVGFAIGGPSGAKTGKSAGEAVATAIDRMIQFKNRDECKAVHMKWLCGFNTADVDGIQRKMDFLVAFFYQVFTNYNVQFWGMLPGRTDHQTATAPQGQLNQALNHQVRGIRGSKPDNGQKCQLYLSYSWENAIKKLAEDSVYRIFSHMKEEVSADSPGGLTMEFLATAFKEGSSEGGFTKDLVQKLRSMKLNEHSGRTIDMKDPKGNPQKPFYSKHLINTPVEIPKDKNISQLLQDSDFSKNDYFYCYSFGQDFSDVEHHKLTDKLLNECGITDLYKVLQESRDTMIKEIIDSLKPFHKEVRDRLQDIYGRQEDIMNMYQRQADHKKCSVVVLGDTGVGKSSIACYLANTSKKDHFEVSHTMKVTTNVVAYLETKVFPDTEYEDDLNTTLKISDCPGLGGTARDDGEVVEDSQILKDIADHIFTFGGEVAAFLLVLDSQTKVQAKRLQKYAEKFDRGGAFIKSLIVIFNKTDIEDDKRMKTKTMKFREAFNEFIEGNYHDTDTKDRKKNEVKAIPIIHFDDNIEIKHDSVHKPFSHDWAKGHNLEQAEKLVCLIKEKSNAPYRSRRTAEF